MSGEYGLGRRFKAPLAGAFAAVFAFSLCPAGSIAIADDGAASDLVAVQDGDSAIDIADAEYEIVGIEAGDSPNGFCVSPRLNLDYQGRALSEGQDYSLSEDITNSGYVTVHGIGAFTGTMQVPYSFEDSIMISDDGLEYLEIDGEACVVGYVGSEGDVRIPSELGGLPVTSVAQYGLGDADSIEHLTVAGSVQNFGNAAFSISSLKSVVFEEGCVGTGKQMFLGCRNLETVQFPSTFRSYWGCMWSGCSGLLSINISDDNPYYRTIDGSMYSKNGKTLIMYAGGKQETEYTVPQGVTTVALPGFREASHLIKINFTGTVETIQGGALLSDSLESIVLGPSVESCESGVGLMMHNFREVIVDKENPVYCSVDGVLYSKDMSTIYWYPYAKSGETYTVPESVHVVDDAFSENQNLREIVFEGRITLTSSGAFTRLGSGIPGGARIVFEGGVDPDGFHQDAFFYATPALLGGEGVPELAERFGLEFIDPTTHLSFATVSFSGGNSWEYSGFALCPKTVVSLDGKALVEGVDYEVSYSDNIYPGTATAVVSGKGAYKGQIQASFEITRASLANVTIGAIPDQAYSGSQIEPSVSASLGNYPLVAGVDYSVSYRNNVEAGTATAVISGIGNFEGTREVEFRIVVPDVPSGPDAPSDPDEPSDPSDPTGPDDPSDPVAFSDVDESTYHADDIAWLAQSGITTGFPDGTFRPMAEVARCDMAAFLYRLAGSPAYEVTEEDMAKFSDVDEGTPHLKEVCWLASEGISTGFPDGTFRPLASIARCDMAAFLQRLGDLMSVPEPGAGASFSDVDGSTPHAESIAWLSGAGITTGFPDGTFRPLDTIVRCDMAAFLHRLDGCFPA